jgi:hypothetical protein
MSTDGKLAGAVVMIQQDGREVFSEAYGWRDREAGDRHAGRHHLPHRLADQGAHQRRHHDADGGRQAGPRRSGRQVPAGMGEDHGRRRQGERRRYDVVPAKRPITIRDLLSHTAGISYGTGPGEKAWRDAGIFGWYFADKTETVADVVKMRMPALPMAAQPGEQWVYGYNTDILGVVVEKLSGKSLDVFFKERLIDPLGMTDTSFCLPPEKIIRLAVVYSAEGRKVRARA